MLAWANANFPCISAYVTVLVKNAMTLESQTKKGKFQS